MLQINNLDISKSTCEAVLRWNHPTVDFQLITDNIIEMQILRSSDSWFSEETVSVGTVTQYSTSCILQPGRVYKFSIRQNVSLTDPDETFLVDPGISRTIIMGKNDYDSLILYKLHEQTKLVI